MSSELIDRKPPKIREGQNVILDAVTVFVNGQVFNGWETATIKRDLTALCGSFSLSVLDRWRQDDSPWPLRPLDKIEIFIGQGTIGNGRVITGYIDSINPSFDKTSRSISISGRDKTSDLVDCSHDGPSEFNNLSLTEIAKKLVEPFGITVLERANIGEPIAKFTVKQGETIQEAIERASRMRGVLLGTSPFGNLILEKRGQDRAATQLIQGQNILSGSASYDTKERFSKYIIKGQTPGTDEFSGSKTTQACATATDAGVTRNRPTIIVSENNATQKEAEERAKWEVTFRAAKAQKINISTVGWLQQDGRLWQTNEIVRVRCPFLGIPDRNLLITSTEFSKSIDGGTITNLELTRQDAFEPVKNLEAGENDAINSLGAS